MMIYIHIPFCVRKCLYCDFLSFPIQDDPKVRAWRSAYTKALCREIEATISEKTEAKDPCTSIFFGGGTPSLLDGEDIQQILDTVRKGFSLTEDAEITLEANPGTVTREKALLWKEAGINRISIGAQAMQARLLKTLGRIHSKEEIIKTISTLKECGFDNLSLDLMFGLPGQTPEEWKQTLKEAVGLGVKHLSCYSLILEEGTYLYDHQKEYSFPGEDAEREMYHTAVSYLKENGFARYEISNFALPGFESRHNIGYWIRRPYFGFGLGAASLTEEGVRYSNTSDMERYLRSSGHVRDIRESVEKLSVLDAMEEFMFLGLRLACGVKEEEFKRVFNKELKEVYQEPVEKHLKNGLLEEADGSLRLSERGVDLANVVMADFLLD